MIFYKPLIIKYLQKYTDIFSTIPAVTYLANLPNYLTLKPKAAREFVLIFKSLPQNTSPHIFTIQYQQSNGRSFTFSTQAIKLVI
jgi:hypothetical protein